MRLRPVIIPVSRPVVRRRVGALVAAPLLLVAAACAPTEDADDSAKDTSSEAGETESGTSASDPGHVREGRGARARHPDDRDRLPAYSRGSPTTTPPREGLESAVAYRSPSGSASTPTRHLGHGAVQQLLQAGAQEFDFDINQISVTPERSERVDFSSGYYSAAQAVIALEDNPAAEATSLADLKDLRLGAQTGTTSLTAIRDIIVPDAAGLRGHQRRQAGDDERPGRRDRRGPAQRVLHHRGEIPMASIIGQFQPDADDQETFGMLFEKGSDLVACVDAALAELESDGTLAGLQKEWLSDTVGVPELQ